MCSSDLTTSSGCIEIVPGTHDGGLASPEGGTVQPADLEALQAEQRALQLPARAGEAIVLHNHLWHRSGVNSSQGPRRAVGISYLDGATRCRRTRRTPRKFPRVFDGAVTQQ